VAAAVLCLAGPALAQPTPRAPPPPPSEQQRIDQLNRDVERAASLRAVKDLQYLYTQYAEFGLWDEMAALFSDKAVIATEGVATVSGKAAIADYLLNKVGGGRKGLPVGGLHTEILIQPVVTLSVDGKGATGRWSELTMTGRFGGEARWSGGMQVNDYVKEGGVWKIGRLNLYPQFAGPYETGFFPVKPDLPLVPYHYIPALAGRPVPNEPGDADRSLPSRPLAEIERRVQAMNDEDKVRNLQNIYGYYVDRKMWSDVTDLFAADGVLEIAGTGVWAGPASIRRALERDGPEGLKPGEVNDNVQFGMIVVVDPNGVEARTRGLQLGMLTPRFGEAYWSVSIFENRYVKQDGVWRIREMRLYPKMKADYYQGWHKSSIIDPRPARANAPDRPSPAANSPQLSGAIPAFFFPNPATGRAVAYPPGATVVGDDRLLPAPPTPAVAEASGSIQGRLAEARRKLDVSKAYDAIENVSDSFGYYLDDFLWDEFSQNMAEKGTRPQNAGFYVGRDRIYRAMMQSHIAPPSPTNPRDGIRVHLRPQHVIDVTPDARSAKIRTRLFLYFANPRLAGAWNSGMYPNDTAVLEDGVWKMDVGGVIDETYFQSRNYRDGWARVTPPQPPPPGARPVAPRTGGPTGITNTIDFPPDIPWTLFADYRRKGFTTNSWPTGVKPMWFHYRNPVSGRTPPNYCPEILKCFGY
jgi:hypothetical protein